MAVKPTTKLQITIGASEYRLQIANDMKDIYLQDDPKGEQRIYLFLNFNECHGLLLNAFAPT